MRDCRRINKDNGTDDLGRFVDAEYVLDLSPFALQSKRDVLWSMQNSYYTVFETKRGKSGKEGIQTVSAPYKRAFETPYAFIEVETPEIVDRIGE